MHRPQGLSGKDVEIDMDYVGIDPAVGLECSSCKHISRMPYSQLLDSVQDEAPIHCTSCDRQLTHDWTTINIVQNIIRRRMRQAQEARERRIAQG
ncbi:MAG: hypothetical protein NXH85_01905 [Pseudomonadaceae bacterium]|nr:hypothetical protein [Pseudomonadaceae bacterium]